MFAPQIAQIAGCNKLADMVFESEHYYRYKFF